MLDRTVDILLVQLLRAWLDTGSLRTQPASWLSALTNPVAGPALAALHTQPGRDWTVDSLAAVIGVSRATLARRFPAKVGTTPAAHLTRWRMDLAAQRLRNTVGAIARSLGYTSEYASTAHSPGPAAPHPAATAPTAAQQMKPSSRQPAIFAHPPTQTRKMNRFESAARHNTPANPPTSATRAHV